LACYLQNDADLDPAYHIDAEPDPAFYVDADPDPSFQFDADPCGSGSTTMTERIIDTNETANNGQKKMIPISDSNVEWIPTHLVLWIQFRSVIITTYWTTKSALHFFITKSALHFYIYVL
jgi:hypothetical protein